jgi:hypothetical protein
MVRLELIEAGLPEVPTKGVCCWKSYYITCLRLQIKGE